MPVPKRKPEQPVERTKQTIPESFAGFPERLRAAMKDDDINATQLGEVAGVSKQVITRALNGERRDGMRAASLVLLAEALGVRVGWLVAGELPVRGSVPVTVDSADAQSIVRATLAQMGYEVTGPQVGQHKLLAAREDPKDVPSRN